MSKIKQKKSTQISHLSAITIIFGSAIGVGIFFKNNELMSLSKGNLQLVIITWLITTIGIICLALALSRLTKIKETNRGILGWASVFTPHWFHKSVANHNKLFFVPIMIFALSLYVTSTFIDAGLNIKNGYLVLLIAFGIFCWMMITNLISLRFSEVFQWIITIMQTLPLVIIPILALINFGNVGVGNTILQKDIVSPPGIGGWSKYMVLILGLPSVLFSFGGFYEVATQRDNLKHPQKLGKALVTGIILILVTYLFLTIAFNVGSSDGTHKPILANMSPWMASIFNLCIGAGVLSIINGLLMSTLTQWKNMMLIGHSKDLVFLHKLIFKQEPDKSSTKKQAFTIWIFFLSIITLFYIVFGLSGILFFPSVNNWKEATYGSSSSLFGIADILSNYMGLVIFAIISTTILSALVRHKKQQIIKVDWKFKIFVIISVTLFYLSILFTIMASIIDLTGFNQADILVNIMKMLVFLLTLLISVAIAWVSVVRENRQGLVKQPTIIEEILQ